MIKVGQSLFHDGELEDVKLDVRRPLTSKQRVALGIIIVFAMIRCETIHGHTLYETCWRCQ